MQDPRLVGKPVTNDGRLPHGPLPVMEYDYLVMPDISANIWHAQKAGIAGWPVILTYDVLWRGDGEQESTEARKKRSRQKRYFNMDSTDVGDGRLFKIPTSKQVTRDEYPFASTVENAGSTFVGHAKKQEQDAQGALISSFYAENKALTYFALNGRPFWFEVKVINMPHKMTSGGS